MLSLPGKQKNRQSDSATVTPFHESLAVLNERVESIPMGWQRLYADMRLRLYAAYCEGREAIVILGAYEQDGQLCVESHAPDFVIQGILRKARMKARCTCTECGQPGRRRELEDWREAVLCGRCAGPRLLRLELQRLLALDRCGTLGESADALGGPRARLLRAAAEASGQVHDQDRGVVGGKLTAALRSWANRLLGHVEACLALGCW
jgi:hypothetical protein